MNTSCILASIDENIIRPGSADSSFIKCSLPKQLRAPLPGSLAARTAGRMGAMSSTPHSWEPQPAAPAAPVQPTIVAAKNRSVPVRPPVAAPTAAPAAASPAAPVDGMPEPPVEASYVPPQRKPVSFSHKSWVDD